MKTEKERQLADGEGGGGDGAKAWSSINLVILSAHCTCTHCTCTHYTVQRKAWRDKNVVGNEWKRTSYIFEVANFFYCL
jgi:hypothetical protein